MAIVHLGKFGGQIILHATSEANRASWFKAIDAQKQKLTEAKSKFQMVPITNHFPHSNRVNCSTWHQGKLVLGTDYGIFVGKDEHNQSEMNFLKVLEIEKVHQVDVLANYDMLLVLAGTHLLTQNAPFYPFHSRCLILHLRLRTTLPGKARRYRRMLPSSNKVFAPNELIYVQLNHPPSEQR
jgi:CNH domain